MCVTCGCLALTELLYFILFQVNLLPVGKIYKIRLELIPTHLEADALWKVKEVKLQDMSTKELLKFSFDRWLCLHQDDGEIMRELPAVRPGQSVLAGKLERT